MKTAAPPTPPSLRDVDPSRSPPLSLVAEHIPHGFSCRSCGDSAYNWVKKCARYVETGEGCCPDFRQWIAKAKAGGPTVEERHKAKLAKGTPFIGLPLGNGEWI